MHTTENLQLARDIVADAFIAAELARTERPSNFSSFEAWGRHIDNYSGFMREGAYDSDIAVVSTLAALELASDQVREAA